jgi:hypothetical protein
MTINNNSLTLTVGKFYVGKIWGELKVLKFGRDERMQDFSCATYALHHVSEILREANEGEIRNFEKYENEFLGSIPYRKPSRMYAGKY